MKLINGFIFCFLLPLQLLAQDVPPVTPSLPDPAPVANPIVDLKSIESQLYPSIGKEKVYKKLVISFENILAQRIPFKNSSMFSQDQLVKLDHGGNDQLYVLRAGASEFIKYLIEKNYELVFISELSKETVDEISKRLSSSKSFKYSFKQVKFTDEIKLSDFGNADEILAITHSNLKANPSENQLNLGRVYYVYPTFDLAKKNKIDEAPHKDYFPATEAAWNVEYYKLYSLVTALDDANSGTKQDFKNSIDSMKNEDFSNLIKFGKRLFSVNNSRIGVRFESDKATAAVKRCVIVDYRKGIDLQDTSIETCTSHIKTIKYARNYTDKSCIAFTESTMKLSVVDSNLCDSNAKDMNALFYAKQSKWLIFKSFAKMDTLTEDKLIQKILYEWDPLSPLDYSVSFHSIIKNKKSSHVLKIVPDSCQIAVERHLEKGENFYSEVMVKKYSKPIKDHGLGEVEDGQFHHWTNATTQLNTIKSSKKYSEIFRYLRYDNPSSGSTGYFFFYLAPDTSSSNNFGNSLYNFKLSKNGRVFFLLGSRSGKGNSAYQNVRDEIEDELIDRNPELAACKNIIGSQANFGHKIPTVLETLAAEASQISTIEYYCADDSNGYSWMMLVGPWIIQGME